MIFYQLIILLVFLNKSLCEQVKSFDVFIEDKNIFENTEGSSATLYCMVKKIGGSFYENPGKIQYTWKFNDSKIIQEPRRYSNYNKLIIVRTDYYLDTGKYQCTAFIPQFNLLIESKTYRLHLYHNYKFTQISLSEFEGTGFANLDKKLLSENSKKIKQFSAVSELQCDYGSSRINWFHNGELINSSTYERILPEFSFEKNKLIFDNPSILYHGTYGCNAENGFEYLESINHFIYQNPFTKPQLLDISDYLIVQKNKPATLSCIFEKYEGIYWFHPNGSFLYNTSKYTISEDETKLFIHTVEEKDKGYFKCSAYNSSFKVTYAIKLELSYIEEFFGYNSILAVYNGFTEQNLIIIPENCKFELQCLSPFGKPKPEMYWLNKEKKKLTNNGLIRVLENQQLQIQNALEEYSGLYYCVVENISGNRTFPFEIKIQKHPILKNSESQIDLNVEEKENTTLECLKKNDFLNKNYYKVYWFFNSNLITNDSQSRKFFSVNGDLIIPKPVISDEGLYVCQLDHIGFPSQFSAGINLKVIEILKFVQIPLDKKLELNRQAKIHCKAKSTIDSKNLKTKWIKGDSELLLKSLRLPLNYSDSYLKINIETFYELISLRAIDLNNSKDENGFLHIKNMTKNEEGFYTCLAFTKNELIFSTIRIDSVVMPKFIKTPLENVEVFTDEVTILDCEAFGDPKPTIRWDKENNFNLIHNNSRYKVLENGSLMIVNTTEEDEGNFGCIAGNSGGFIRAEVYLNIKLKEILKNNLVNTPEELYSNYKIQKTVAIALSVAFIYILAIIGLLIWFRCKRIANQRLLQNEILHEGSSSNSSSSGSRQGTTSNSLEKDKSSLSNNLELKNTYQVYSPELQKTSTCLMNDSFKNNLDKNSIPSNVVKETIILEQTKHNFDRNKLQNIMLLGHGEFGEVFLAKANSICKLNQDTMVMVKTLQNNESFISKDFNKEINMFKNVSNNNIIKLLATCFEKQPNLMILEYSDWGDLKQFLLATRLDNEKTTTVFKPKPLDKNQILKITLQISNAMNYLISSNFVHKDLAARNCLISSNLDIKITSCSLSKDTYCKEYIKYRNRDLPLRWSPNEAIFQNEWSKYSDVWSFAVLFWEIIFLAELPYSELRDDQVFNMLKCNQLKLNFSEINWLSNSLNNILTKCLTDQPSERPEFYQIIEKFSNEIISNCNENL